ncbi:small secreted domain DUF320 [Haloactinospora alba]|uniref:Small secreted domain DUF320 n=1 Tax=Haloactinospora alba TaxID=405555 RepID=A0A543NMZ8_9ACTN|nr:chaplin family protein [Haloactinospora alba]TQN33201.1 small secreted domain DUF320 [Haloactinospora alba]
MSKTSVGTLAALAAAGVLSTAPLAHADTSTSGNGSIGGGNQVDADADVPVNLCGNAVAVLGVAGAKCEDSGAKVEEGDSGDTSTSGDGSIVGGNQADADADVPVNGCGNAVGVAGNAGADCEDSGAEVDEDGPDGTEPHNPPEDGDKENPDPTPEPTPEDPTAPPEEDDSEPDPSPTTEAPSEEKPEESPSADTEPAVNQSDDDSLPTTGANALAMVGAALAAVLAGAGAIALSRFRKARAEG